MYRIIIVTPLFTAVEGPFHNMGEAYIARNKFAKDYPFATEVTIVQDVK